MMKTHIEHQHRGERKAHGLRFSRLSAAAGLVLLSCLVLGVVAMAQADTTTDVSLSPTSSVTGQDVTLTATVAAATTGTPTGTVTFYADGSPIGTDTLNESDPNIASITVPFNAEDSPVTITATYAGDGNYNGSTDDDSLTVTKAATATSVVADDSSYVTGETVTLTATVTVTGDGSGTPTGTVEFFRDTITSLGTVAVDGSGQAVLLTSFAYSDGSSVPITAKYNGDGNYNGSPASSVITLAVAKASTTVVITSDEPDASVVGQPYTVSGTVAVDTPGGGTPTGTVTVGDGSVTSAAGTVGVDGSWSCSLTSTSVGSPKTITATYSGDSNYSAPATAPTTTHTVDPADTTTTVSSSVNPSVTGQSVTFTATVSAVSPGAGTPTGTVTFYKGSVGVGNEIGSAATLNGSGQATVSTTFDASESPVSIFAEYNGDSNYNTSISSAFTQNVNKANTTTEITGTSLGTPTVVGVSYTVSGTVAVVSPGSGTPSGSETTSGTVQVSDGTDTVTGIALTWSTDHWTWSTSSFVSTTAGAKTLTATYSGGTKYQPSSDTDSHVVNKASTTVVITSDLTADTVVGESYTVSGKVTPVNADGTHTTTGNVQVSDDGTPACTCTDTTLTWNSTDNYWEWSYDLISTTAGSKTITATYFGDANYEDDTTLAGDATAEQPVAHTVNKANTTVAITSDLTAHTVVGQSYTVSGRVTPTDNTTGTHTNSGNVEVSDDGTPACTCTDTTLTWNSTDNYWEWSCDLISTTAGSKTITATYSGDSNYNQPASDPTTTHTVDQATTTVAITGAALGTATVAGETYTVSGRVTPAYTTGIHTNSGTVDVSDGTAADDVTGIPLTWSVDHWEWSCSFTSNTAGASKTITATYSGDTNYGGNSDTDSHTVDAADTTTTVTSSVNPSVTGQNVTLTATVAAAAPGSGTPTGTVTFYKGSVLPANQIGSPQTLAAGQASVLTTFDANENPVNVYAQYGGDSDYNTSTSAAFVQSVNKATTTTSITGTNLGTATDVGVSYTVNGTVAVGAPGVLPLTWGYRHGERRDRYRLCDPYAERRDVDVQLHLDDGRHEDAHRNLQGRGHLQLCRKLRNGVP